MISYLLAFLQGMLTFVSPCILPMIPLYIFYIAGDSGSKKNKGELVSNSLAFVVGFAVVFTLLGAAASLIGGFLNDNIIVFRRVSGVIMVIIGLNFLGIIKIGFLNRVREVKALKSDAGFYKALIFGFTFAFAWSPCITAFLGNTLLLASNQDTLAAGSGLLLVFSLGLGIPFIITAILYDKISAAFEFIKKNYSVIKITSGIVLIAAGVMVFFDYIKYLNLS